MVGRSDWLGFQSSKVLLILIRHVSRVRLLGAQSVPPGYSLHGDLLHGHRQISHLRLVLSARVWLRFPGSGSALGGLEGYSPGSFGIDVRSTNRLDFSVQEPRKRKWIWVKTRIAWWAYLEGQAAT